MLILDCERKRPACRTLHLGGMAAGNLQLTHCQLAIDTFWLRLLCSQRPYGKVCAFIFPVRETCAIKFDRHRLPMILIIRAQPNLLRGGPHRLIPGNIETVCPAPIHQQLYRDFFVNVEGKVVTDVKKEIRADQALTTLDRLDPAGLTPDHEPVTTMKINVHGQGTFYAGVCSPVQVFLAQRMRAMCKGRRHRQ